MRKLRELDYPITGARGVAGGYGLGAGSQLPPLALDDDEAVAIAIALRTAAASGVLGIGEPALRALIKLEQVMPSRVRGRLRALRVSELQRPATSEVVDAELLTGIGAACRDHRRMTFDYAELGGEVSAHRIEPHELVTWGARWYLVAWDLDRGGWSTFPVDRIAPTGSLGPQFTPRQIPEGDAASHVARSVAQLWPHQAKARLRAAATPNRAGRVSERGGA